MRRGTPGHGQGEALDGAAAAAPTGALGDDAGAVPRNPALLSGDGSVLPNEDGFGERVFPTAAAAAEGEKPAADAGEVPAEPSIAEEIAAVRAEGLTARQLRMARRVALRHGVVATSDFDAVRQLRKKGVDPFKHGNMLELVVGEAASARADADASNTVKLPQTVPQQPGRFPSVAAAAEHRRERELIHVQLAIARRRQRKLFFLFLRLMAFVFLPTAAAGYYFYSVAAPMYGTKSEFVIQQAAAQGTGGMGSLFSGTAMATAQDSITVQSYLQSREAMLRLEADLGFKEHFSSPLIDPIQRLEPNASNEATYKVYRRNVKIGYDPTEGIIKMEVIAPDPTVSAGFSRSLISYAEEQVDNLTQRLREDQMSGAIENYHQAEANVRTAQQSVITLQEQRGIFSAQAEVGAVFGQISQLEGQLLQERLSQREQQENATPNAARVAATERNIARLATMIGELRAEMTEGSDSTMSLARITGELRMAESELETRRMLLAQSLEQLESARIEANRQVRYLSTGVSPVPPDRPTYPRSLENTAVAFLILSGIYLMLSITVTILREQVSA